MSDCDPNIDRRATPSYMSYTFNPTANHFAPGSVDGYQQGNAAAKQVSAPLSPYLEARIFNLEEEHASLQGEVDTLKELYHGLAFSVDKLKKGGWPVHVGPFQDVDLVKSHQSAIHFKAQLQNLSEEVRNSAESDADGPKLDSMTPPKINSSVPTHARAPSITSSGTNSKSLPPHLRGAKKVVSSHEDSIHKQFTAASADNRLVTDGQVDPKFDIPAAVLSLPTTPETVVQDRLPAIDDLSLSQGWKPHYVKSLAALPDSVLSKIPSQGMVTFHPSFISNTFDGMAWSPGLRYIKGDSPCILKNRTYYILDPKTEPFLPDMPGGHGAKLSAFFNVSPEEMFSGLEDDSNSYEDVPMFVEVTDAKGRARYAYYGNYSQTRWSDKLDYDTMVSKVPHNVKEYWASELTDTTREEWVTSELKKHFFRKPEYEGRLFAALDDETTIASAEEVKLNESMAKDVRKHVERLREWEREANMKTVMMKKQFILDAFDAADADDPPALRLWWEYLQCIGWRKDFYELLVTLQSRNPKQYLK